MSNDYIYLFGEKCPFCGKNIDEIIFDPYAEDGKGHTQGYDTTACRQCKKRIKVEMDVKFTLSKWTLRGL